MPQAMSRRVFFALWPDAAARQALEQVAYAAHATCGGRRLHGDGLHLTLAFIGAASPARLDTLGAAAAAAARQVERFDLRLDRLGYWRRGGIVWLGQSSAPPRQRRVFEVLRDELAQRGVPLEARPWVPHVSLLRHARGEALPSDVPCVAWPVAAFALVESHLQPAGARYRTLAEWPLAAPLRE